MNYHIDVTTGMNNSNSTPQAQTTQQHNEMVGVLREILEVQREVLKCQQILLQYHDASARWRSYLARWQQEFPDLASLCQQILPTLERTFGETMHDLIEQLQDEGPSIESDYALRELLDRFGPQFAHLNNLLSLVAPLADPNIGNDS